MRAILRDHYEGGAVHTPRPPDDPHFFSLCMHADPLDNTTAAMVARLPADPAVPAVAWVCLGSPCTSAFVPCYLDAAVPSRLARGGEEPDGTSPWWRLRELLTLVERDFARFGPLVRGRWDAFEAVLARRAAVVEAEAEAARRAGHHEDAAVLLSGLTARSVDAYLLEAEALVREIGAIV
jgi:dipeptidase